jgi:hypothetical protein
MIDATAAPRSGTVREVRGPRPTGFRHLRRGPGITQRSPTDHLEIWELRVSYLKPDAGHPDNDENALSTRDVLPATTAETDDERLATSAGGASAGGGSSPVVAAAQELDSLAGQPLAEHPDVYERVHAALQDALADIDHA